MTVYSRIPDIPYNPITDTDSYKLSHYQYYPPGMTRMFDYFEARGGEFPECTLFGLQYLMHRYLSEPVTHGQVREAARFVEAHGQPFNEPGYTRLASVRGHFPIRIRAIPEGLVVPVGNAIMTVETTSPNFAWAMSPLETKLVRLWEGSTVAMASRESMKIIKRYLDETSDNTAEKLPFALHDFGGRGVTCYEQSQIAGGAHLASGFLGSDTNEGIRWVNHYYHDPMAGFSVPATEHSTGCLWGRDREFDFVERFIQIELIQRQLPPGLPKIAACVADTYDVFNFARTVSSGKFKPMIKNSGGTFVMRPDSGDPMVVLPQVFDILWENLKDDGHINSKGYKVFPAYFRVLQGDGINIKSMHKILARLKANDFSTENIVFGSGGGLLQRWQRDDQKWKLACSAGVVDGEHVEVKKDPITDPGKRSKAGRLDLILNHRGEYETVTLGPDQLAHPASVMQTVFEDGKILADTTLAEVRGRMAL